MLDPADLAGPQKAVLRSSARRLLVRGGPGSGKTAIALLKAQQLIDEQPADARRPVLFLTFARAAVAEIAERVAGAGAEERASLVEIETFHGFSVRLLNAFGRYGGYGRERVVIVTDVEADLGLSPAGGIRYRDLIPRALELLRATEWVRSHFVTRYAAIISDESQDTGDREAELLELLASQSRLICLGDPDQRIYDFITGSRPERWNEFRATAGAEINLGRVSHRDPSTLITRLALALAQRQLDAPAIAEACAAGRLVVLWPSSDVYADAIAQIRLLRTGGASSVGVFVAQRRMVDELAERLSGSGIVHEIAGLDEAAGQAQATVATLARYAAGDADQHAVRERLAVFLASSQRKRDLSVPQALLSGGELPGRSGQRLAELEEQLQLSGGSTVAEFLALIRPAWARLLLGGSPRLWELGLDALRGQTLADASMTLSTGGADRLAELAAIGRLRASTQSLVGRPLSVRLMTRHQAKGREMDAVVFVHHPDDFERAGGAATDRRVLYVSLTRARQTVALVLRPQPMESMSGFINLCGSSQRADVRRPN